MFDIVSNYSKLKLSNKVDNQASAIVSGPKTGVTLMQSGWLSWWFNVNAKSNSRRAAFKIKIIFQGNSFKRHYWWIYSVCCGPTPPYWDLESVDPIKKHMSLIIVLIAWHSGWQEVGKKWILVENKASSGLSICIFIKLSIPKRLILWIVNWIWNLKFSSYLCSWIFR